MCCYGPVECHKLINTVSKHTFKCRYFSNLFYKRICTTDEALAVARGETKHNSETYAMSKIFFIIEDILPETRLYVLRSSKLTNVNS